MTQCQTYLNESLWTSKQSLVESNKTQRKLAGEYLNNEPAEHYFDQIAYNECSSNSEPPMWQYYHYLSEQWVKDLFGLEWSSAAYILKAINAKPYECDGWNYYTEADIIRLVNTISISHRISALQNGKQAESYDKPVYTNEDMKTLLNVGDSTLRSYRDKLLLNFSKVGDKIWYTKSDLEDFLNKTHTSI